MATFRSSYNEGEIVSLLNGYPSIFTRETIIGGYEISEYIKERSNKFEAMIKCSLPYIVVCIAMYIIYYRKILPILNKIYIKKTVNPEIIIPGLTFCFNSSSILKIFNPINSLFFYYTTSN